MVVRVDIGPVTGAQPGSEAWTTDMPHEAWREMTKWFIRRYKGVSLGLETVSVASGLSMWVAGGEIDGMWDWVARCEQEFRVYLTYRTQPKAMMISSDSVGRPTRADYVGMPQSSREIVADLLYARHKTSSRSSSPSRAPTRTTPNSNSTYKPGTPLRPLGR